MVLLDQGKKKKASVLDNKFCEQQVFSYLLPKGNFDYDAPSKCSISPARYFSGTLLCMTSISTLQQMQITSFFSRSVYEQHHLLLSIKFAMHKIRPATNTAEAAKNNFKQQWKGLLQVIKHFYSFMGLFSFYLMY